MSGHSQVSNAGAHTPFRKSFANDGERTGDTGPYTAADVTARIAALQDDTKTIYVLTNNAPVTWTALTDAVFDSNAVHTNLAAEISAVTEKGSPVGADLLLIEDSADSNNKKRVQISNLPGGGGGGIADTTVDATQQTTDETPTGFAAYTTSTNNRAIKFAVSVWARENATNDVFHDVMEAIVNRDNGGALTIKDVSHVALYKDQAAWSATLELDMDDVRVRVTGESGKTIEWRAQMEVSEHG